MNNNNILELSAQFRTRLVIVTDDDTETRLHYQLRELTSEERDRFRNEQQRRAKLSTEGKVVGVDFIGLHAALLTRTMFKIKEEAKDGQITEINPPVVVTAQEIKTWRAGLSEVLYKAAEELNNLDTKQEILETEAKNE